jgi:acetyl/propionyl-CoA carboxylase alpha subunit
LTRLCLASFSEARGCAKAMEMEMTIEAEEAGSIEVVYCALGQMLATGQLLLSFRSSGK